MRTKISSIYLLSILTSLKITNVNWDDEKFLKELSRFTGAKIKKSNLETEISLAREEIVKQRPSYNSIEYPSRGNGGKISVDKWILKVKEDYKINEYVMLIKM